VSLSPESHRDPSDTRVATLATIGPDGRPQLSEVWFLGDGDSVALSLNTSRQKAKNLAAGPQCCLFVFDLDATQRYLELRGDALLVPDDDYAFADRVGQKYGADLRQHDGPNERPTGDRADHPPQGQRRRHARLSPGPRAGRPRLPGRSTATAGPVGHVVTAGGEVSPEPCTRAGKLEPCPSATSTSCCLP
jgi:PPOX class probable F420-dependent enzyme